MIRTTARAALTAALLLGAASIAYAADAPKPPKLTGAVAKALGEAQAANNKKDYPTALAAIDKAKAVDGRTGADNVMINRFSMAVHIGMGDYNGAYVDAEAAADAALADPAATNDPATVYKPALQLALTAKHYDTAAKYAMAYLAAGAPAADLPLVAQALYLGGDYAGATAIAQANVNAAKTAGTKPARNDLDIIMSSQVKAKDEAGAEATLEQLVQYYNMPEDWGQILGVSLGAKGMEEIDYIYVGRLALAVGAKITPQDAQAIGSTANSKLALYGDAEQMQAVGGPAPDPREAADKKSIPAQIAAGAKQGGEYNVKTAEALYGYKMYPEAQKMATDAKAKGGMKDPTEADMVIGMAQAAQGQYDAAATTFGGITRANPAKQRIVRLWAAYAKSKAAPATAAAPAAPAPAK